MSRPMCWDTMTLVGVTDESVAKAVMAEMAGIDIAYAFDGDPLIDSEETVFCCVCEVEGGIYESDYFELSRKFPDILFCIDREVEFEGYDGPWKLYIRNGKHAYYYPETVWPEFNENDLEGDDA